MGLQINTNIAAMNSYRNLSITDGQMAKSLEKLSSGFRINRAADDAAGLAISEGLRSQIGGLKVAVRNTQDAISVVQTAEGALTETHAILQRMRDLSVQASNSGGLNGDARNAIQSEMSELKDELTRIADTTQFNGTKLLDGNYTGTFQVGANQGETISVRISDGVSAADLDLTGVDVTAPTAADARTGAVTTAAASGAAGVVTVDAAADFSLSESFDDLNGTVTYGDSTLDLSSVDFAEGSSATERTAALQAAVDERFGSGQVTVANTATGLTFTGTAPADADSDGTSTQAEIDAVAVNFTAASGAQAAISKLDEAITSVSGIRAELGAKQNRFEHTINNLNVAVENLSASESRIRDTDMALEMVEFTRAQILSQAGTAMLAQANQAPQGVLRLLG